MHILNDEQIDRLMDAIAAFNYAVEPLNGGTPETRFRHLGGGVVHLTFDHGFARPYLQECAGGEELSADMHGTPSLTAPVEQAIESLRDWTRQIVRRRLQQTEETAQALSASGMAGEEEVVSCLSALCHFALLTDASRLAALSAREREEYHGRPEDAHNAWTHERIREGQDTCLGSSLDAYRLVKSGHAFSQNGEPAPVQLVMRGIRDGEFHHIPQEPQYALQPLVEALAARPPSQLPYGGMVLRADARTLQGIAAHARMLRTEMEHVLPEVEPFVEEAPAFLQAEVLDARAAPRPDETIFMTQTVVSANPAKRIKL